ncbi:MAG: family 43 glycosylhydrolase, partial [Clostridia bacterium]|nr:family 43 glycosylhydrolase [Clostridia bacterium]
MFQLLLRKFFLSLFLAVGINVIYELTVGRKFWYEWKKAPKKTRRSWRKILLDLWRRAFSRERTKGFVFAGWYADPEARVYNGKLYGYVTKSLPFEMQNNLDMVISEDLEHFEIKKDVLDMSTFNGVKMAVWAPTVIEYKGKYYIVF